MVSDVEIGWVRSMSMRVANCGGLMGWAARSPSEKRQLAKSKLAIRSAAASALCLKAAKDASRRSIAERSPPTVETVFERGRRPVGEDHSSLKE
jgi:hypothetical protein